MCDDGAMSDTMRATRRIDTSAICTARCETISTRANPRRPRSYGGEVERAVYVNTAGSNNTTLFSRGEESMGFLWSSSYSYLQGSRVS
jgi:hypothetical protein